MRRFRFHLGTLVILILVLAVGFAALRESSDLWESGMFTLTLGVLLTSILLAIYRSEKGRGFWLGFALFGSAYLGLSLLPSIESMLITTKAFAYLSSKVPGRPMKSYTLINSGIRSGSPSNQVQSIFLSIDGNQAATDGQGKVAIWKAVTGGWSGSTENFVRIGHSLFALLAGWIGGQLSRRLCRPLRSPGPNTAVDAGGTAS
jgi:hypothetical protein